jgi:hypothetical protein
LFKVLLVARTMAVVGALLTGILFLAALFSHQAVLASAALLALIAGMLGNTVIGVWGAWALWHSGAWMGLDGKRHTRVERPGAFRTLLVGHLFIAVVWGVATSYLTWTLCLRF